MFFKKGKNRNILLLVVSVALVVIVYFFWKKHANEFTNLSVEERETLAVSYGTAWRTLSISSFEEVKELDFSYSDSISNKKNLLNHTSHLEKLYLNYCTHLDNTQLQAIPWNKLPELKILNLMQTQVTEESVDTLNQITNLEELTLGCSVYPETEDLSIYPEFSDEFLKKLDAPKLRRLTIYRNCTISDQGLLFLEKFPNLEEVSFQSVNITKAGIESLIEKMQDYKKIRFHMDETKLIQFFDPSSPESNDPTFDQEGARPRLNWKGKTTKKP